MDTQTKRVMRALRFAGAVALLILQVGREAVVGATRPAIDDSRSFSDVQLISSVFQGETRQTIPVETKGPEEADAEISWPMSGANPERTSWTSEEVRGQLRPEWYRPIEPYIPAKVQIIAANGALYISTARGLYALDAATGAEKWVYATEMPLGNSPTIANGVAYVGGLDRRLHAIDAATGMKLWTFEAGAGFDTNPVIANNMVYLGNRDGYFYAVYADEDSRKGQLAWRYPGSGQSSLGPIHFSAAYKNNVLYFASDDCYAYAVNATTGTLVWKSQKLPTAGFHSWWPVISGDHVVFSASRPYRSDVPPGDYLTLGEPDLTEPFGPLRADKTRDATNALNYFEDKPWLRSYYVLEAATGREVTYDFDRDGKPEYAPLLSYGTHSGNRYPAVSDPGGVLYTANRYSSSRYDNGVAAWKLGANSITTTNEADLTWDEPLAHSMGGNMLYWTQCCDRQAGGYDARTGSGWTYFGYAFRLSSLTPGYDVQYMGTSEERAVAVYGGWNGVYGSHGDQNAPIPYKGRIYVHRSNSVIALSVAGGGRKQPMSNTVAQKDVPLSVDPNALKQKLASEVQNILDAGHLRPGFGVSGFFSGWAKSQVGDNLTDYWHNPLDTIVVLTRAWPHLSPDMQAQVRTYLQSEYANYSPCQYTSVGWDTGAGREFFDLPPEVAADIGKGNYPPTRYSSSGFEGWTTGGPFNDYRWTPYTFYAMWKYAQAFGGAKGIFDYCRQRWSEAPSDDVLAQYPFAHNAWIAGYWGYLELQKLAGYPEDASKRAELDRLLSLRAQGFSKDNPGGPDPKNEHQPLSVARNFIFLTPELGQYLRDNALSQVEAAVNEYEQVAPYWFVTQFEATYNEGVMQHLYDYNALFAAKAMIFQDSMAELSKYLDVPAFARGDLFYIQNLVLALEAQGQTISKEASRSAARQGETITYTLTIGNIAGVGDTPYTVAMMVTDTLPAGLSYAGGLCSASAGVPVCSGNEIRWQGAISTTSQLTILYAAQVVTQGPEALTNLMQVDLEAYGNYTRSATIIANPLQVYLPVILKDAAR